MIMSATWDDIKNLAADLQRVQLTSASQRLSERNCVEIIQKLIGFNLIQVVYTCDGRTYITLDELKKLILEELEVQNFRVNIVDLQAVLNVDLSHIEASIKELLRNDSTLHFINGEFISDTYFRQIAHDINDLVFQKGHVSLGELTKNYNLPTNVIVETINQYLKTVIKATLDHETLYTMRYIWRYRSLIQGYFCAVLKPCSISAAASCLKIPEYFLKSILDELIAGNLVSGSLQNSKAIYVPDIFVKSQGVWMKNFFDQNEYLDYETVKKFGIATDVKQYLKKHFGDTECIFLSSCVVKKHVLTTLESSFEECTFVDVLPLLPASLTASDIDSLVTSALKSHSNLHLVSGHFVISDKWINDLKESFEPFLNARSESLLAANPNILSSVSSSSSSRKKDADMTSQSTTSGVGKIKTGGGTQGREVKIKSTKKKYMKGGKGKDKGNDSDDESSPTVALTLEDITGHIKSVLAEQSEQLDVSTLEDDDEFYSAMFDILSSHLNSSLQEKLSSALTSESAGKKQAFTTCENKLNTLVNQMRVFEKGAIQIPDVDLQTVLNKHLMKTIVSSIWTCFLEYVCINQSIEWTNSSDDVLPAEHRQRYLGLLPGIPEKTKLVAFNQCLAGDSLEKARVYIDQLSNEMGFMIKTLDKKAEKNLCSEIAAQLQSRLANETDLEVIVLITVSLLIQNFTGGIPVHAPGRSVSSLIKHLEGKLKVEEHYNFLNSAVELIIKKAKKENVNAEIEALLPKIADIGTSWKTALLHK